jgi:hypothetical protein
MMMVLPMLPALAVAAADPGAPVEVRGIGITCPSAAEVAQQVGRLLPAGAAFDPGDWIELREVPSGRASAIDIDVRLLRRGLDAPLGERRIERVGTCADIAEAIAVVAASWKRQFALPEPTVPVVISLPPPAVRAPAAGVASTAPGGETRFGLAGFGGMLTAAAGGVTPVVGVEGELRRGRLLARLQASATGARDISVAGGRAEWQRVLVGLAAGANLWRTEQAFLDVTVGPLVGVTRVRGIEFAVPGEALGFDIGVAPAVRLGRTFRQLRMGAWIGVGGVFWLRSHVVAIDGTAETRALPRVDGSVAVGLSYVLGR